MNKKDRHKKSPPRTTRSIASYARAGRHRPPLVERFPRPSHLRRSSVSLPAPPSSVSLPTALVNTQAAALPTNRLSLPLASIAETPVKIRFSTLAARVRLSDDRILHSLFVRQPFRPLGSLGYSVFPQRRRFPFSTRLPPHLHQLSAWEIAIQARSQITTTHSTTRPITMIDLRTTRMSLRPSSNAPLATRPFARPARDTPGSHPPRRGA